LGGKLIVLKRRNSQRQVVVTRTLSPEVLYRPVIALLTSNIFERGNSVRGLVVLRCLPWLRWNKIENLNRTLDGFRVQGNLKKGHEAESL